MEVTRFTVLATSVLTSKCNYPMPHRNASWLVLLASGDTARSATVTKNKRQPIQTSCSCASDWFSMLAAETTEKLSSQWPSQDNHLRLVADQLGRATSESRQCEWVLRHHVVWHFIWACWIIISTCFSQALLPAEMTTFVIWMLEERTLLLHLLVRKGTKNVCLECERPPY